MNKKECSLILVPVINLTIQTKMKNQLLETQSGNRRRRPERAERWLRRRFVHRVGAHGLLLLQPRQRLRQAVAPEPDAAAALRAYRCPHRPELLVHDGHHHLPVWNEGTKKTGDFILLRSKSVRSFSIYICVPFTMIISLIIVCLKECLNM